MANSSQISQAQRAVIGGTKSSWRPVNSGVPQGWTLAPTLSNLFPRDLDNRTECTLNKFTEDTKLEKVDDKLEGCAVIQGDFDRLEK